MAERPKKKPKRSAPRSLTYEPEHIDEPITFRISRHNHWTDRGFELTVNPPATIQHRIGRWSRAKRHVVGPKKMDMNLKNWVDKYHTYQQFVDQYRKKNPAVSRRPTDKVKFLILGLVKLVGKRRRLGQTTGFLNNLEKIGVKEIASISGAKWDNALEVFSLDDQSGGNVVVEGRSDEEAVLLILERVFRLEETGEAFPQYVQSLVDLIRDSIAENEDRIVHHPILWVDSTRLYYFEKVWQLYKNKEGNERKIIKAAMENVRDRLGWFTKIVVGSPFNKIFEQYKKLWSANKPIHLLKFVRECIFHLYDKKGKEYTYIADHLDYLKAEVVDMEITQMFPTLLEDLAWELQQKRCYV